MTCIVSWCVLLIAWISGSGRMLLDIIPISIDHDQLHTGNLRPFHFQILDTFNTGLFTPCVARSLNPWKPFLIFKLKWPRDGTCRLIWVLIHELVNARKDAAVLTRIRHQPFWYPYLGSLFCLHRRSTAFGITFTDDDRNIFYLRKSMTASKSLAISFNCAPWSDEISTQVRLWQIP